MDNRNLEFTTDDLVILNSYDDIVCVNGVIHDDQRLFVINMSGGGDEWEVPFTDVMIQYTKKEI